MFIRPIFTNTKSEKWARHYWKLCNRAMFRDTPQGYLEWHHIFPKCMHAGYDNNNIVVGLTAREHFVAHQLLAKMYPEHRGIVFAITRMANKTNKSLSNRLYSWHRELVAKSISARNKGNKYNLGKRHSSETRLKQSVAKQGVKRGPQPEEVKQKIAESNRKTAASRDNRTTSESTIQKMKMSHAKWINSGYVSLLKGASWYLDDGKRTWYTKLTLNHF